jgi:hypothetical protein
VLEEFFGSIKEATKARKLAAKIDPPEGKSASAQAKNAQRRAAIQVARIKWEEWETSILPTHNARIAKAWKAYECRRVNWDAQQLAINFKIQAGGSDVLRKAEVLLDARLPSGARILLSNHDEICVSCPKELVQLVDDLLKNAMHEAFSWLYPSVPIESKPTISETWG